MESGDDMIRCVLASGSPRRKELLTQVGIEYEVITSNVDESIELMAPDKTVEILSQRKAESVFNGIDGEVLVIGADTVVALDGEILGKPESEEHARKMLQGLSDRAHSVFTGVTMIFRKGGMEKTITFSDETKVYVDALTENDIDTYIKTGECMDKAGAYGIQGFFAAYVEKIEGDYNNVVGLPVEHICRMLRALNL